MAPLFCGAVCIFLLVLSSSSSVFAQVESGACSTVADCSAPTFASESVTCVNGTCVKCNTSGGSPPVAFLFFDGFGCTTGCLDVGDVGKQACREAKSDDSAVCLARSWTVTKDKDGLITKFAGGCGFCRTGYVISEDGICVEVSTPPPDSSPPDSSPPVVLPPVSASPDPFPPRSPPPPPSPSADVIEGQSGTCAGDSTDECKAPTRGSVTCFNNKCSYCDLDKDSDYNVPYTGSSYSCEIPCVGALSAAGTAICRAKTPTGLDPFCSPLSTPYFAKSATYRTKDGDLVKFDGLCSVCLKGHKLNKERTQCVEDKGPTGPINKTVLAIILAVASAVIAGIIGLGFYFLQLSHQNRLTRKRYPLADYLRTDLKLRKVSNFDVNPGLQFRHAVDALSQTLDARGVLRSANLLGNLTPSLAMAIAGVLRVRYGFQPRQNETEFLVLFARDCGDEVSRSSLAADIEAMVANNPGWHGLLLTPIPRAPNPGGPAVYFPATAPAPGIVKYG